VHGEHLCASWARETSGSAIALRFHNVYGAGMPRGTPYAGVAALFRSAIEQGRAPRVFEDGRQRRDFVHVDDVAAAVVAALDADAAARTLRPYNVGSGRVTTVGEVARALSQVMSGPAPVTTGEFRLGDVRHVTASSERIRRELGWSARRGLADGLAALVAVPPSA
jgi:dTDP-L-rhamnose 4-epimerase